MKFYILGSNKSRPESKKTIFADGSADKTFRNELDLELSHWVPNKTPLDYKYDTSTEICINFAKTGNINEYDLAINNHLDVDGLLSIFSVVNSNFAIKNEEVIISASKMGDFWAYGKKEAQILFQGLTLFMDFLEKQEKELDIMEIYAQCFEKIFELIETKTLVGFDIKDGLEALEKSIALIENNLIERLVITDRFVSYNIPKAIAQENLAKCLRIPSFNEKLSEETLLLPQSRNFRDREKVHLVSVEGEKGIYYDLFYPSYIWAETPHSWRAEGLKLSDSTNLYYYGFDALNNAIKILNEKETNEGAWILSEKLTPFSTIKGRNFPVILSFMKDNIPSESSLAKNFVIETLSTLFL
jgi:hypothetical protein